MLKEIKKGFTLAEVLIVIGIIGVVAALTLPNLNHATGDKETVTRLQKAYSILSEANDRAVAIYGPVSSWASDEQCKNNEDACYMKRIGEFLKISKSCDEDQDISCDSMAGQLDHVSIIYQLPDGITLSPANVSLDCDVEWGSMTDVCIEEFNVDINGADKGKNDYGYDIFRFILSDSKGLIPHFYSNYEDNKLDGCYDDYPYSCTFWVIEHGNLDYLKTDSSKKCNDSNIILDGTTNTSCH